MSMQRVAVGLGLGHQVRADGARGAGAVLDDHRLAPALRERVRDEAREHVRGRARASSPR